MIKFSKLLGLYILLILTVSSGCVVNQSKLRRDSNSKSNATKIDTMQGVHVSSYSTDIDSTALISNIEFDHNPGFVEINLGCVKCETPKISALTVETLHFYNKQMKYNTCNIDSLLFVNYRGKEVNNLRFTGIDFTDVSAFNGIKSLHPTTLFFSNCILTQAQIDTLLSLSFIQAYGFGSMQLTAIPTGVSLRDKIGVMLFDNKIKSIDTNYYFGNIHIDLRGNPLDSTTRNWIKKRNTIYRIEE